MKKLILIASFLFSISLMAQNSNINHPFQPGEKLTYVASYNMKGIMTELAGINMEVIDVPGKKKPIYRLKFTANTLTSWDEYVKVRHAYQTYIDATTLRPLIMAQDSDIKGQTTKAKYKFKNKAGIAELEVSKNGVANPVKTVKINSKTYDLVSLMYYSRTIDFDKIKMGSLISSNLLILERNVGVDFKLLSKEIIDVKGMGKKECYKVAIVLSRKFVVEPNVNYIWYTADKNKIPVKIETTFKEGKALVNLIDYQGLN